MQNQEAHNVKTAIEQAREKLEILEEVDLLESEFRLIQNEYLQRRRNLEEKLNVLSSTTQ